MRKYGNSAFSENQEEQACPGFIPVVFAFKNRPFALGIPFAQTRHNVATAPELTRSRSAALHLGTIWWRQISRERIRFGPSKRSLGRQHEITVRLRICTTNSMPSTHCESLEDGPTKSISFSISTGRSIVFRTGYCSITGWACSWLWTDLVKQHGDQPSCI